MNYPILVKRVQALQKAVRKLPHQLQTEPLELVFLNQFVQVNREQLKCDARVVSERERVEHVYHVHRVVFILFAKVFQNTDLLLRLPVEPLLVAHHLERDVLALLVVVSLHYLSKTSLPDHLEYLVPVRYVIVRDVDVRALLVVILAVIGEPDQAGTFLGVRAYEVHLGVIEYFSVLVRSQFVHVKFHDLLGAGGCSRWPLVGRLRVVGRRRGRAWLQRRQRPVPEQRAPESVRAPQRHIAGHGRAPAASSALARGGRAAAAPGPRFGLPLPALSAYTAPHCTCTACTRRHTATLHISHRPGGAIPVFPLRAHSVSVAIFRCRGCVITVRCERETQTKTPSLRTGRPDDRTREKIETRCQSVVGVIEPFGRAKITSASETEVARQCSSVIPGRWR